jgi:hypothetical protein
MLGCSGSPTALYVTIGGPGDAGDVVAPGAESRPSALTIDAGPEASAEASVADPPPDAGAPEATVSAPPEASADVADAGSEAEAAGEAAAPLDCRAQTVSCMTPSECNVCSDSAHTFTWVCCASTTGALGTCQPPPGTPGAPTRCPAAACGAAGNPCCTTGAQCTPSLVCTPVMYNRPTQTVYLCESPP